MTERPMSSATLALDQFHADLQRANHLLRLIKEFRRFAGSDVPAEIREGTVAWSEAADLADAAPHVRTDLPVLSGSILLYICGRFEHFVRELVVALADDMAAKASTYHALPDRLRNELRVKTLEVAQNPSRFGYSSTEAEQLVIGLAENLTGSNDVEGVSISSRVLSITETNMNPATLAEVLRRVDITDVWKELGKQSRLKAHLAKIADTECTNEAKARLEALMKDRNGIAHPTGANVFPGPDKVLEASEFLKVLSGVIADLVEVPRPSVNSGG
nr:hypothetical protein GCM10017745_71500 [Saccharothrix mutabilis subsp. capreolus]